MPIKVWSFSQSKPDTQSILAGINHLDGIYVYLKKHRAGQVIKNIEQNFPGLVLWEATLTIERICDEP